MRKLLVSCALVALFAVTGRLSAQQFDAGLGFGTVKAPSASNGFPSESGGLYISFSGNVILKHHIGFGGEVAPRVRQAPYGFTNGSSFFVLPYRPIFYDFNAVYGVTSVKKKIGGDLMAGIGGQDLRFYTGNYNCGAFSCTNYQSSNHFAWHFGADFRYYVWGHAFIRPEAHYYVVHNNGEFNNVHPARYAISIGYSFMPGFEHSLEGKKRAFWALFFFIMGTFLLWRGNASEPCNRSQYPIAPDGRGITSQAATTRSLPILSQLFERTHGKPLQAQMPAVRLLPELL